MKDRASSIYLLCYCVIVMKFSTLLKCFLVAIGSVDSSQDSHLMIRMPELGVFKEKFQGNEYFT